MGGPNEVGLLFNDTPLWMVEDQDSLARLVERLRGARALGVDTESDSFHHYQEKVCLIQISDLEADYIVDPLAIPDLSPLGEILADRSVVKILHGADYDVVCLKRDFGFKIHNIFDTMISAQMLGLAGVGLGDLIAEFFGIELEKKYQRHDWSDRPLQPEHIEYARGDTHWLLALHEILVRRLDRIGRLAHVEEECRLLEEREWEPRPFDENGWLRIKASSHLDDRSKRVLKHLFLYRDQKARELDRPPFKVIPDPVLVQVAEALPRSEADLDRIFRGKSAMKRRHAAGFVEAVKQGISEDWPIPKAKARKRGPTPPPGRLSGRAAERAMNALKDWRNALCDEYEALNPVAVVSNATLRSIARMRPQDLEELGAVPEVRNWQVDTYGHQILRVLDDAAPPPFGDDEDDSGDDRPRKRRRRRR